MNLSADTNSERPVLFKPLIIIAVLTCIPIGIFLFVFQHYMNLLFKDVEKEYRQGLVNVISVARNAIEPDLAKVRSGEITREEAIRRIRPLIRSMTYEDQEGKNYIYMAAYDGTVLVQPYMIGREMTNRIDARDIKGLYIAREFIKAAKEHPGGSFVRYHFSHLPGVHEVQEKMAYIVGLPELECYIGTGMYIEKTLKDQREILANIEYSSIWLFIITLIPISVSGWVIVNKNRRLMTEVGNRKKADQVLLENMELLRATLNATTDGILVVNKENRINQINRQFLDMWRIPADLQAIDDDERMLSFVSRQVADSDGFLAKVVELYQSQLDSLDEIVLKDGRVFERYSSPMILAGNEIGRVWDFRDITKRKQAEESVRASRKLLNDVLQAASEFALIATDPEGIITFFNRGAELMLGYSMEEMVGKQSPRNLHLESELDERSRELSAELGYPVEGLRVITAKAEIDGSETREWTFVRKDGATLLVSLVETAIRSEEDEITGYLGIAKDITRSRQTEEKFSKIFMMAPDMITISRLEDGLIADVNLGFEEITGWKRNEVMGRHSLELDFWANPGDRALMIEELRAGGDVLHREIAFRHKDGSVRTGIYSARIIHIENELSLIFVMQDITQLKETEMALREKEERLSGITSNLPGSVFQFYVENNGEYNLSVISRHLPGFLDLPEGIEAAFPTILSYVCKEDRERFLTSIRTAVETCSPWNFEGRFVKPRSGEIMWFQALSTPTRHENRLVFNGILQDITVRMRLEEERKILEGQLFQSQKMDAIGQLAGGVAHDFNNILMSIEGNASLIMMDYAPDHPHYKRLSRIEENVERGANLTGQLLGFARGGKYEIKVLSINDLVRNSAIFFTETKKEIESDFQLQCDVHPVEGDAGQLEQVLLNIYINAGHAMPGGGRLRIQTSNITLQDPKAEAFEVKPGDYVKISVSDTGTGMDKETLKRIFEPFFTTKAEHGGTGLGLASAYGIIRNHGGVINAYSEPGRGSTFNIYLPSSDKKASTGKSGKPVKKLLSGSSGILLVDDEPEILATASSFLEMLGYVVFRAGSGQQAVAIYQEKHGHIDLVILDMIMPGTSGPEALKILREINPDVKIVLSSGYSLQGEVKNVMEMGCLGFIQKPYNFAQLSTIIYKAITPASGAE